MATTAALLQIQVAAETGKATLALKKLDKQLTGIDKTTATATTRTSSLGKASRTAGSHLRSAAGYAASAALAYLSISQAKTAVTTTQDLAKTTAGLNRNLGLSTKTASKWGTVAKARDIDAKALTMSFTTLSRRITDAAKGSDTAVDSFKDIGVTQKDLKKTGGDFNKQLLLVADAFGESEGGALRQQAAQKLLGRGYQTLLPMFADGAKGLKEQQEWADKYGATLGGKTVKEQMALVNAQRESKVAMLGLQTSFATALTPALMDANSEFQKLARLMASDKLTTGEKFARLGHKLETIAGKGLDAFVHLFSEFEIKMARSATEHMPKVAKAFLEGFINAPIWGQLLVGGWLIHKFGGLAAFGKLGTKTGSVFGKKFGLGIVAALVLLGPDIVKWAFNLGKDIGDVLEDAIKGVADPKLGAPLTVSPAMREWQKKHGIEGQAKVSLSAGEKLAKDMRKLNREIERDSEQHQGAQVNITKGGMRRVTDENKDGLGITEREFKRTQEKLDSTTGRQTRQVVGNTNEMVNKSSGAIGRLGKNTNSALKAFGAKPVNFAIVEGNKVGTTGLQRGGLIGGTGNGDTQPVMAEPGEGFINKTAVKRLGGKRAIDWINSAMPRFQKGGTVGGGLNFALGPYNIPPIDYAADHAGGNSHVHVTGTTTPWVVALGKRLQSMGFMVGEHPAFGGVTAQHSATGGHYDALAIDINSAADETRAEVASIARLLGGKGGLTAAKLKRLILKGPDGPLKTTGQGAMDKVWKAGKALLSRSAPTAGIGPVGDISGPLQGIAKRMVSQRWGGGQWPPFNELVQRESGWNPGAVNPSSGAAGLAQALPPSKYPPGAWPYTGKPSAVKQLQWMIQYIAGRYGTPAGALGFHDANNYYQQGGVVDSPFAPKGKFGRAHYRMAQLPGMKKRLQKLISRTAKTDERIQIAQTMAGRPDSPGGSELTGTEKERQLGLFGRLLGQLGDTRQIARQGFRTSKHFKKNPAYFRDILTDVEGLTRRGGRLFDTKTAIAELKATPSAGSQGLSIDQLVSLREAFDQGIFPVGHNGGRFVVPGGGEGMAVLQDGETVTPKGASTIIYSDLYIDGKLVAEGVRHVIREDKAQDHLTARAGRLP